MSLLETRLSHPRAHARTAQGTPPWIMSTGVVEFPALQAVDCTVLSEACSFGNEVAGVALRLIDQAGKFSGLIL